MEREKSYSSLTELCSCGNVLGCCLSCPKAIPYLDCLVSVYQEILEDGSSICQIKTTTYSKPTDVHHSIHPSSCTPNLTRKSPAIIKGVAHRLRLTNMMDTDLIAALNNFSGYLEASGYDKTTTISFFTDILKVSNMYLAFNIKEPDTTFKVPLVTKLHPALPNLAKIIDQFYPILKQCPVSSIIFPRDSIISAYRKLPTLSTILANNPFSPPITPTSPKGFHQTHGCSCKICKEATFSTFVSSPNLPGRGFTIPEPINCKAVNVVYAISCPCGLMYVGRTSDPRLRWSNHKSHIRHRHKTCNLATHCIRSHMDTMEDMLTLSRDIKEHLTFTLVQSVGQHGSQEALEQLEEEWRNKLHTWAPLGLNTREDGPQRMRKKNLHVS
jgi:predicted GIY-YIG superfamily endonuclease